MGTVFYKYRKLNKNTLDSLLNKYFYYSNPSELNDPFDCIVPNDYAATHEEIKKWIISLNLSKSKQKKIYEKLLIDKINTQQKEIIENAEKDSINIYCLSTEWNESLMWAHYADSYKGICIGYSTDYFNNFYSLRIDYKTKYNELFQKTDFDYYYATLFKVNYNKNNTDFYNVFKENYEAIIKGLLYKQPKWGYENEYRSIILKKSRINISNKIYYKENILKEVIFGYKVDDENIKSIKDIVSNNYTRNVKYFQIRQSKKDLKLYRIEI